MNSNNMSTTKVKMVKIVIKHQLTYKQHELLMSTVNTVVKALVIFWSMKTKRYFNIEVI